jgi:hypothetical protein
MRNLKCSQGELEAVRVGRTASTSKILSSTTPGSQTTQRPLEWSTKQKRNAVD